MPLKGLLLMVLFAAACLGGLAVPMVSLCGYVLHYHVSPETQWWGEALGHYGIRFSMFLASATAIGILMHWRGLAQGHPGMTGQEWLVLLFLGITWLSTIIGVPSSPSSEVDPPEIKFTKIVIFCLMLTHLVTTERRLSLLLWTIVAGAAWFGCQAYSADASMYTRGRLNGIGGPDFREANALGAYLASIMFFIGAQFLSAGVKGKILCAIIIVFAINAMVLTGSRGAIVGLAGGMVFTLVIAPGKHRWVMLAAVLLMGALLFRLADSKFWARTETITASEGQRDRSAESRIEIWKGAVDMIQAYPLGVGAGNFQQMIGRFAPDHPNRDTHNTYLRCCSELGIQGGIVFLLLILNAMRMLRNIYRRSRLLTGQSARRFAWISIAMSGALITFLLSGLTASFIQVEALWWFLCLPVCLERALDNFKIAGSLDLPESFPRHHGRETRINVEGGSQ